MYCQRVQYEEAYHTMTRTDPRLLYKGIAGGERVCCERWCEVCFVRYDKVCQVPLMAVISPPEGPSMLLLLLLLLLC